ncbi:MAG: response regulator [Proteobacteria bacterium]|nr:response regulator [Pseudomonadota bacterium]
MHETGDSADRIRTIAPLVLRSYLRMGAEPLGATVQSNEGVLQLHAERLLAELRFVEDGVKACVASDRGNVEFHSELPSSMGDIGAWSQRQAANVLHAIESTREPADAAQPLDLLIVDDEPILLHSLARVLRGHQITHAASVTEARASIAENRFDGILLDVMMPGAPGTQLLDELRVSDPDLALRVCLMTAEPGQVAARKSTPILVKPFTRNHPATALRCIQARGARATRRLRSSSARSTPCAARACSSERSST